MRRTALALAALMLVLAVGIAAGCGGEEEATPTPDTITGTLTTDTTETETTETTRDRHGDDRDHGYRAGCGRRPGGGQGSLPRRRRLWSVPHVRGRGHRAARSARISTTRRRASTSLSTGSRTGRARCPRSRTSSRSNRSPTSQRTSPAPESRARPPLRLSSVIDLKAARSDADRWRAALARKGAADASTRCSEPMSAGAPSSPRSTSCGRGRTSRESRLPTSSSR